MLVACYFYREKAAALMVRYGKEQQNWEKFKNLELSVSMLVAENDRLKEEVDLLKGG